MISTFLSMLRSLAPSDPVLLLGVIECENAQVEQRLLKDFFGISKKHQVGVEKPDEVWTLKYYAVFANVELVFPAGIFHSSH